MPRNSDYMGHDRPSHLKKRSYRRKSKDVVSSSDDEDNYRHDRFRSERNPENNYYNVKQRYEKYDKYTDHKKYRRKNRSRSRSPNHRSRSAAKQESVKKRSSSEDRLKKSIEKPSNKNSAQNDSNVVSSKHKQKANLSMLLKKFDEDKKKTESTQEISSSSNSSSSHAENSKYSFDTAKEEDLLPSKLVNDRLPIGPALPPHLQKSLSLDDKKIDEVVEKNDESSVGTNISNNQLPEITSSEPVLPSIGPALPTNLQKSVSGNKLHPSETSDDTLVTIGPALPPHLQKSNNDQIASNNDNENASVADSKIIEKIEPEYYGPSLPPCLKKDVKKVIGPVLPANLEVGVQEVVEEDDDDDDEDIVGPVPIDSEGISSITQQKLEMRAMEIKLKLLEDESDGNEKNKRESWMLELPPGRASSLGLGPRTFRTREGPDMGDRSCWTDTPADKLQKQTKQTEDVIKSGQDELRKAVLSERDKVMEELTKKDSTDSKPLSLLEIHQKNLRKKKKKEEKDGTKPERRPFDRNIDLQVNRFDEAQRKAIYKKAQLLNTRFSQGESKYL